MAAQLHGKAKRSRRIAVERDDHAVAGGLSVEIL